MSIKVKIHIKTFGPGMFIFLNCRNLLSFTSHSRYTWERNLSWNINQPRKYQERHLRTVKKPVQLVLLKDKCRFKVPCFAKNANRGDGDTSDAHQIRCKKESISPMNFPLLHMYLYSCRLLLFRNTLLQHLTLSNFISF